MNLRRIKTTFASSLATLSLLAVGVAVRADDPPKDSGPVGLADDTDLAKHSTEQLVSKASGFVSQMEKWLSDSFWLLEAAVSGSDINAANTRNEAITVMKGLVKLSEQNLMTMRQKAAEGDRHRVENEYVKISIAYSKVQEYYAQVKSAGGVRGSLEVTAVERRLVFSGELPVVEEVPTLFTQNLDVFMQPPVEPPNASPYF